MRGFDHSTQLVSAAGNAAHAVNGKLTLDNGADVGGSSRNVNGLIRVAAARVGGEIDTVAGAIVLGPNAPQPPSLSP